ncbi:MAG: HPr-rel-A system PqqD family peptide chaperone [Tenuifilum sp.]|jgi:PqqD family protein of HPr-rel-A system|uniref:HPr-rel-A system PqqD family peptide chaperone n=1 Tax=Tenuifilum TaxID=2760873 RepID=UPI0019CEB7BF|nr:HPr-rel-A system PqqD family peptide chaperone [Bacteroidales bacterium]HOK61791.1 HPr-rel-A system PqqD family peptide chaperone [Tenuifilum sp.]MBP7169872.1 HPr-rel-A system PqqD family peptide chaperone [Bacteroidales bacterium]MBP9029041.1 HPr-rel-A system PqqD family peptide chaperone [Bacteroidales bacterium]HOK86440.1 HPr-rel-A system PqqD family peptide chaperone [Tenuifilum sp.]
MKVNQSIAISENGFIFNPITGDTFTLNDSGFQILTMLKSGKSQDEIKDKLLSEYEVDELVLERYLQDFISDLKRNNLLLEE